MSIKKQSRENDIVLFGFPVEFKINDNSGVIFSPNYIIAPITYR